MSTTRVAILLLATCPLLPACSHAPPAPSKEEPAMTPDLAAPAVALEAPQVLQRVLDLIDHSKALGDLTPAHVSQAMGVPMQAARDGSARHGYGASLGPQWAYGISLETASGGTPRFELSFDPVQPDASMTAVCQLDYEGFAGRLEAMGFKRTPYSAEHGRAVSEWFDRPGLRVTVYPQGESDAEAAHRCVRMVTIP